MGGYAWVTLATNDSYSLGALVLGHSLKRVKTNHQLAILITPGVTNPMREKLKSVFNVVQEVNVLESKDEANLRLLKRPELGITFTKLHCWRLTQFDKCVFLDADTLVLQNCDELFEREELSAAPDVGWPDCFNSGVFVYRPSNETYEKLVQFALEKGSFDGGDQGLLNLYFSDWATKDISKHLPFIYNLCSTACYSYLPAFKQFGINTKIIHFIGSAKPWLQYFNTETKKVQPSQDMQHLEGILQQWWNIFCEAVHPQLTTDMGGLAASFAQITLGQPRPENALDEHLRRQGWETGNIDYMGKDSFDNIWNKICETLSTGSPTAASTTETSTSADEKPTEKAVTEASIKISEAPLSPEATSAARAAVSETSKVTSETQQTVPSEQSQTTVKTGEQVPTSLAEIPTSESQQQPTACVLAPKADITPKSHETLVCPITAKATSESAPPSGQEEKSQVSPPETTSPKTTDVPKISEEIPSSAEAVVQPAQRSTQTQESPQVTEVSKQPDTVPAVTPTDAQVASQPVQPDSQQQQAPQVTEVPKQPDTVLAVTAADAQVASQPVQPGSQQQDLPQATEVPKEASSVAAETPAEVQVDSQPAEPSSQPQEIPQVAEGAKEPVAEITAAAQTESQSPSQSSQPQGQELPQVTEFAKESITVAAVAALDAQTVSQPPPPSTQQQELPPVADMSKGSDTAAMVTPADAQTVSQPAPPSSQQQELPQLTDSKKADTATAVTPSETSPQTPAPPASVTQGEISLETSSIPASESAPKVPVVDTPPTPAQAAPGAETSGVASSPKAVSDPVKADTTPSKEADAVAQSSETTATSGSKPSAKTKSEAASATSTSSPTPPPRKTGGGAKKSKSKK